MGNLPTRVEQMPAAPAGPAEPKARYRGSALFKRAMIVFKSAKLLAVLELDIKKQVKTNSPGAMVEDHAVDFNRDIKILAADGRWIPATALLDTQCHVGNWISWRLLQRLGKLSQISTDFNPPELVEASGQPIHACGVIDLNWKWEPRGTRTHECQFYVFPDSTHLDVLFGVDFILSENLLRVNESVIIPLVEHKKLNKDEKAAVKRAKVRQEQEKAALKERKIQAKTKASVKGQSSQGGEQQGS